MTEMNLCSIPPTWPVLALKTPPAPPSGPLSSTSHRRHYEGREQPAHSVFPGSGHSLVLLCGYLALKPNKRLQQSKLETQENIACR